MTSKISNTLALIPTEESGLLELIQLLEAGLVITDHKGQVLLWNPWMERITGLMANEILSKSLSQVFNPMPAAALLDAIEQACNDRLSRRLSHQLHPLLLPLKQPSSGGQLHHSILVRPLTFAGQAACLLQINDVTSTVRREQHLRDAEALLRFEKQILSLVAHNQEIDSVWQALLSGIEKLAPGSEAGLLLLDEQQHKLVSPKGITRPLLPQTISLDNASPAGLAMLTGQVQYADFWWCYPLTTSEGQRAGILQLAWPSSFDEPDTNPSLLERSAQLAIIALQNHQQLLQVRHLAQHDALTGLANRSLLNEKLEALCSQVHQDQSSFALLFIDLDGFKLINDQHGHDAGDAFLVELSQRLKAYLNPEDLVARLGGDELVILSQQATTLQKAFDLAEQINQRLAQPFAWKQAQLKAGASIGIAVFPDQGDTANQLLTQADNAMYLAKSRGKGQAASCDLS